MIPDKLIARAHGCALYALCCLFLTCSSISQAAGKPVYEELLVRIKVNEIEQGEPSVLIRDQSGRLYLSLEELQLLRLRIPQQAPIVHEGIRYFPVDSFTGVGLTYDEPNQAASFVFPAEFFEANTLETVDREAVNLIAPGFGAFVNYDVFRGWSASQQFTTGLTELGVFTPFGVLTSNHFTNDSQSERSTVRLESTFTQDFPEKLATLRLGDTVSRAVNWSAPNRIGGIQYATNFRTQPSFVATPNRGVSGIARTPSTVDVYVNNVLLSRQEVAPGPFTITNLPSFSGVGNVRLIIRDANGIEQSVAQAFYVTPGALKGGQHDFSYELGSLRENFGSSNADYGAPLASATHRYGYSDNLTWSAHAEVSGNRRLAGLGSVVTVDGLGAFQFDLANSDGSSNPGNLYSYGFEQVNQRFNFGYFAQKTDGNFTPIVSGGLATAIARSIENLRFGYVLGAIGTVSMSYVAVEDPLRANTRNVTTAYSTSLGRFGFVGLFMNREIEGSNGDSMGLFLNIPFDANRSLSAFSNQQGGQTQTTYQYRQQLPVGEGYGYTLEAGVPDTHRAELISNQRSVTLFAGASQAQGQSTQTVGASGAVVVMNRDVFASRKITDSFAVVKVAEVPDVKVYLENQYVGVTDSKGELLVPRIRPYERNRLSFEQGDVPFDFEIGATALFAAPYFRSGLVVPFPVRQIISWNLNLQRSDGRTVPSGSKVLLLDQQEVHEYIIGNEGLLYLVDLPEMSGSPSFEVIWADGKCRFKIEASLLKAGKGSNQELGTFTCN